MTERDRAAILSAVRGRLGGVVPVFKPHSSEDSPDVSDFLYLLNVPIDRFEEYEAVAESIGRDVLGTETLPFYAMGISAAHAADHFAAVLREHQLCEVTARTVEATKRAMEATQEILSSTDCGVRAFVQERQRVWTVDSFAALQRFMIRDGDYFRALGPSIRVFDSSDFIKHSDRVEFVLSCPVASAEEVAVCSSEEHAGSILMFETCVPADRQVAMPESNAA